MFASATVLPTEGQDLSLERRTDMRGALLLCVGVSLAIHLFALSLRVPMHRAGQASPARAEAPESLRVRLIQGRAQERPALPAEQAESTPGVSSDLSVVPSREPPSRRVSGPSEPLPAEPTAAAHQPPPKALAVPKDPDVLPAPPHGVRDEYLPRSQLTVAPVAQTPAILLPPPGQDDGVRRTGMVSLFIDEEGRVRRVESHEPLLPGPFEQAAREAFIGVRFSPGERDGQPVKSRIRVEVEFDGTPSTTP